MKRMTIKHPSKRCSRSFVITAPPWPSVGDTIALGGEDGWTVTKVADVKELIEVTFPQRSPVPEKEPQ